MARHVQHIVNTMEVKADQSQQDAPVRQREGSSRPRLLRFFTQRREPVPGDGTRYGKAVAQQLAGQSPQSRYGRAAAMRKTSTSASTEGGRGSTQLIGGA